MVTKEQLAQINNGLDFAAYMNQWQATNALPMTGLDPVARRTRFYSRYNLDRQERVERVWSPSPAFMEAVNAAPGPSTWLFMTEDWCVDSAYSLPLIRLASEQRGDVTLRILLRDTHPTIMDRFLTDGKRSIPKFIGIADDGFVQFVWGPQPEALRLVREHLMESGAEGSVVSSSTVDWYADRGWLAVEQELADVFTRAVGT